MQILYMCVQGFGGKEFVVEQGWRKEILWRGWFYIGSRFFFEYLFVVLFLEYIFLLMDSQGIVFKSYLKQYIRGFFGRVLRLEKIQSLVYCWVLVNDDQMDGQRNTLKVNGIFRLFILCLWVEFVVSISFKYYKVF